MTARNRAQRSANRAQQSFEFYLFLSLLTLRVLHLTHGDCECHNQLCPVDFLLDSGLTAILCHVVSCLAMSCSCRVHVVSRREVK